MDDEKDLTTVPLQDIKDEADPPEEVRALRRQVSNLEARLDEYKREQGSVIGMIRDMVEHVKVLPAPKIDYKKPSAKKVESPIALVAQNTDWHMGAEQEEDEIEGFNKFSPKELRARIIDRFVPRVLNWADLHRSNYDVDECRILVTGDMVSGDIHDNLRVTNAFPTPVQVVECGMLLAEQISLFSPHFKTVVVDFVLADNHGRLTKKPQHKEGGYNTFNYPLAHIAKQQLRDHKNVTFNMYPREQQIVEVKGREYLILHGHQIRGWAGIPYYGFDRKVGKESAKRMLKKIARFDRMITGHFHAPLQHPLYWIGGSPQGTDAYDHSQGRHAEPQQSAWFVHPKHGEFDRTEWVLTS
jgi:hypothetical protein